MSAGVSVLKAESRCDSQTQPNDEGPDLNESA